jgi:hypothetical protein
MRVIQTSLNEEEYKIFNKKVEKMGCSEYALLKTITLDYLKKDNPQVNMKIEFMNMANMIYKILDAAP